MVTKLVNHRLFKTKKEKKPKNRKQEGKKIKNSFGMIPSTKILGYPCARDI